VPEEVPDVINAIQDHSWSGLFIKEKKKINIVSILHKKSLFYTFPEFQLNLHAYEH
jgi:hypothetical protein